MSLLFNFDFFLNWIDRLLANNFGRKGFGLKFKTRVRSSDLKTYYDHSGFLDGRKQIVSHTGIYRR